jgi:rare lipoprotein A
MKATQLIGLLMIAASPALAQTPATAPAPTVAPNPSPIKLAPPQKVEAVPALAPVAAPAVKTSGEHQLSGKAAYYSSRFNGRKTASGQLYESNAMTTAHKTLPFGTKLKITNAKNNRSVIVRVNDRGPSTPDRVFDLSRAAAAKLGYLRTGLTDVTAEIVAEAPVKKAKSA